MELLVTVTRKTVESIQTMIARQNAFTQSIDVMSTNMKELLDTTKKMNYQSLKVDDKMMQDNEAIGRILEATSKACDSWFFAADFIPNRGGRALGDEMEFVLLQTEGLQELAVSCGLAGALLTPRIATWTSGTRRTPRCSRCT